MKGGDYARGIGEDAATRLRVLLVAVRQNPHISGISGDVLKAYAETVPLLAERAEIRVREIFDETDAAFVAEIEQLAPQVIGFSCYVWSVTRCLALASRLRSAGLAPLVVLGGPHLAGLERQVLEENPGVDVVVHGEGEETFAAILGAQIEGRPLLGDAGADAISGISCRSADGSVTTTPPRVPSQGLDAFPSAFLSGAVFERRRAERHPATMTVIEQHRGCPFSCAFCYWGQAQRRVRWFSEERVMAELEALARGGVRDLYFTDSSFNMKRDRARRMLAHLSQIGFDHVVMHLEAHLLDAELSGLMARIPGLVALFGLQSVKRETLEQLHRLPDTAPLVERLAPLLATDVRVMLQAIVGLPTDTPEDFRATLRFVMRLPRSPEVQLFHLQVLPGSEYWDRRVELGLDFSPAPPHYIRSAPGLSADALRRMKADAWLTTYYYNQGGLYFLESLLAARTGSERGPTRSYRETDSVGSRLLWQVADRLWEAGRLASIPDAVFTSATEPPEPLRFAAILDTLRAVVTTEWGLERDDELLETVLRLDGALLEVRGPGRMSRVHAPQFWPVDGGVGDPVSIPWESVSLAELRPSHCVEHRWPLADMVRGVVGPPAGLRTTVFFAKERSSHAIEFGGSLEELRRRCRGSGRLSEVFAPRARASHAASAVTVAE